MDGLTLVSLIHFYDTRSHETLCGLRGFEHRSTKHARGVTCPSCVGLLRDRPAQQGHAADQAGLAGPAGTA